jgi:hypothetical protein
MKFFNKLKIELPYNPPIHFWIDTCKGKEISTLRHLYSQVYCRITITITIRLSKIREQPKCLLSSEQMKKMSCLTHTHRKLTCNSLKKEILPFGTTQMSLEDIGLSELSQAQKEIHVISLICVI